MADEVKVGDVVSYYSTNANYTTVGPDGECEATVTAVHRDGSVDVQVPGIGGGMWGTQNVQPGTAKAPNTFARRTAHPHGSQPSQPSQPGRAPQQAAPQGKTGIASTETVRPDAPR